MRVEVLTDRPDERFVPGTSLHPEGEARSLTIARAEPIADGPGWWLAFAEVRSRAAAERLRDLYREGEVDRAADLEPGQAYWHETIGTEVRGEGGRSLGRVADIYRAGETEVYVVRGGPVGEFDLPAVRGIVTEFAPERGEILVDEASLALDTGPVDERPARPRKPHRWSRHGKGRPTPGEAGTAGGGPDTGEPPAPEAPA